MNLVWLTFLGSPSQLNALFVLLVQLCATCIICPTLCSAVSYRYTDMDDIESRAKPEYLDVATGMNIEFRRTSAARRLQYNGRTLSYSVMLMYFEGMKP